MKLSTLQMRWRLHLVVLNAMIGDLDTDGIDLASGGESMQATEAWRKQLYQWKSDLDGLMADFADEA
jgi:hypothetical protein